jgi:hypothetical protein
MMLQWLLWLWRKTPTPASSATRGAREGSVKLSALRGSIASGGFEGSLNYGGSRGAVKGPQ